MANTRVQSYENTSLAVECPACGDFSETPLTLLEAADRVDCPACGEPIEIDRGPLRSEINRLLERCALTDAQFSGK
jgi:endogenous inhibitor of DNA gyrase (YacG/DUF329 family)